MLMCSSLPDKMMMMMMIVVVLVLLVVVVVTLTQINTTITMTYNTRVCYFSYLLARKKITG